MITSNEYIQWYAKEKEKMLASGMYASEPTFLFKNPYDDEWVFNEKNWNGGDILRRGLLKIVDERKTIESYDIRYYWHDDQTTILVLTSKNWYEISWYKSRGCTEIIRMNGKPIYLDDYIDLCNALGITLE